MVVAISVGFKYNTVTYTGHLDLAIGYCQSIHRVVFPQTASDNPPYCMVL